MKALQVLAVYQKQKRDVIEQLTGIGMAEFLAGRCVTGHGGIPEFRVYEYGHIPAGTLPGWATRIYSAGEIRLGRGESLLGIDAGGDLRFYPLTDDFTLDQFKSLCDTIGQDGHPGGESVTEKPPADREDKPPKPRVLDVDGDPHDDVTIEVDEDGRDDKEGEGDDGHDQ